MLEEVPKPKSARVCALSVGGLEALLFFIGLVLYS
jgi:hypothetical protein